MAAHEQGVVAAMAVVAVGVVQSDQGPVVAAVATGAGGLPVPGQLRADGQLDRPAEAERGADLVGAGDGQHLAQAPSAQRTAQVGVVKEVAMVIAAYPVTADTDTPV